MPIITIAFGYFLLRMQKYVRKREKAEESNNEKVVRICSYVFLIVFNIMNVNFIVLDYKKITDLSEAEIDTFSLLVTALGIGFIIMGIMIFTMDFMVKQISYAYDKNTLFIGMETKINKENIKIDKIKHNSFMNQSSVFIIDKNTGQKYIVRIINDRFQKFIAFFE